MPREPRPELEFQPKIEFCFHLAGVSNQPDAEHRYLTVATAISHLLIMWNQDGRPPQALGYDLIQTCLLQSEPGFALDGFALHSFTEIVHTMHNLGFTVSHIFDAISQCDPTSSLGVGGWLKPSHRTPF
jgi:hypothetical protein